MGKSGIGRVAEYIGIGFLIALLILGLILAFEIWNTQRIARIEGKYQSCKSNVKEVAIYTSQVYQRTGGAAPTEEDFKEIVKLLVNLHPGRWPYAVLCPVKWDVRPEVQARNLKAEESIAAILSKMDYALRRSPSTRQKTLPKSPLSGIRSATILTTRPPSHSWTAMLRVG